MKYVIYFVIIFLLFSTKASFTQEGNLKNEITKNLRCLICQGQSVYDSDSEFALSLKLVIKNKIEEGLSEKPSSNFLLTKILILLANSESES